MNTPHRNVRGGVIFQAAELRLTLHSIIVPGQLQASFFTRVSGPAQCVRRPALRAMPGSAWAQENALPQALGGGFQVNCKVIKDISPGESQAEITAGKTGNLGSLIGFPWTVFFPLNLITTYYYFLNNPQIQSPKHHHSPDHSP